MKTTIIALILLASLFAVPALSAEQQFKDVPKDHWAADYVAKAASDGIMKGYPGEKFKGNKPVTRYELAVAIEKMIEVVENSLKPELKSQPKSASPAPAKVSPKPKAESQDPAQKLKAGGYIAENSPLLSNCDKTVSPTELAQALSSVAEKLIENHIAPPKGQ